MINGNATKLPGTRRDPDMWKTGSRNHQEHRSHYGNVRQDSGASRLWGSRLDLAKVNPLDINTTDGPVTDAVAPAGWPAPRGWHPQV